MNIQSIQCGFYTTIKGRGRNEPLHQILTAIKTGKWRQQIEHLRRLQGNYYDRAKEELPCFMVSSSTLNGGRKTSDLGMHTGLLQIDLDHLADFNEAVTIREKLAADHHVLACWISPGGRGVKAIVPINADHQTHKASFVAAQLHFQEQHQLTIDTHCSDPGRLCFVSHDPDLRIKDSAECIHAKLAVMRKPVGHSSESDECSSSTLTVSTSALYHLHHSIFADFPGLQPLYRKLVSERIGKVSTGLRNDALVEMVPVLYSAIASKYIPAFAEELHTQHQGVFRDPLSQHLKETNSLVEGCARDYVAKRLTSEEALHYRQLNERQQTVFRICHALTRIQSDECPPPYFFLSAEKLGHRLGVLDAIAHRELRKLCHLGILRIIQVGTRRVKGQPGRATHYEWLLPTRPFQQADD